jgi:hypothetical protein
MHRHTARARGGFFSAAQHAVHQGLQGLDGFVRRYGPFAKNAAMMIAPALAKAGQPALAAGVATVGQGMDSYASLRNQLDA